MFFQKKYYKLFIAMLSILMVLLLLGLNESEAKISAQVLELTQASEEEIEVLIHMAEQVDTNKIARTIKMEQPKIKDNHQLKNEIRIAVTENLQQTAQKSQISLLNYLKSKKREGKVSEIESYYIVNMIYARLSPELIESIASRSDVKRIYPNTAIEFVDPFQDDQFITLETAGPSWNIEHIEVPAVWEKYGLDGSGVVIGIIDTGVNLDHPALKNSWRGYNQGELNADYNWFDPLDNQPLPDDPHGHGTQVAGIITGSDPDRNIFTGVAPGASWIAYKGLNSQGTGSINQLLAAGEYMLAPTDSSGNNPRPDMAPDIVVNSWGSKTQVDDWYKDLVNNWRNASIFPIFAAGNSGPGVGTINNPANYPECFAVGAIDTNNALPGFSSRGPGAYGEMIKPNLVAPGVRVYTTEIEGYGTRTGTSLAAPHIAGIIALMLSVDPQLSVHNIETTLMETAIPLTDQNYSESPNYGFGYGLVNALSAVESLIDDELTLAVSLEGEGTTEPAPGQYIYSKGEQISLSATPSPGWQFKKWVINDLEINFTTTTLSMYKDKTAKAVFEPLENDWVIIPSPDCDAPLNEAWLITFNRPFSENEIDGMVIEKNNNFIPVEIHLNTESGNAKITPVNPYQPGETYSLRVFLSNANRYIMYFKTELED